MGILIGILIRLITFPGVILDLIVNIFSAKLLDLEITEINYDIRLSICNIYLLF